MTKSLLNLILSAFALLAFSNLGFADDCTAKTSAQAEKPTTELAEAEATTDDLLPICCAAAFAELVRPADKAAEGCCDAEVVTEVAKADLSAPEGDSAKDMKTGDCATEDAAPCDQKKSCCGTVESNDSKASAKQDS